MKNSVDAERVCGFYVSNMHFATMILPFINREIKEETNFITFFELNQKSNINTVLSGVVANLEDKEKIIKIDWGDTKILKISDVEKKIKNNCQVCDEEVEILLFLLILSHPKLIL